MQHPRRRYFSLVMVAAASLACAIPGIAAPESSLLSTAVAQTVSVRLTQNLPEPSTPTLGSIPTSIYTFTLTIEPSITLSPTLTSTPTFTFTPTSSVPLISVSLATNCRNGPGKVYDLEGALLVGEFAEVYGRDPTSRYWYIRNPDPGVEFCWVWGEYATITGSPLLLPVFTPPPTPTPTMTPTPVPSFSMKFNNSDSCTGWWVDILVKNTGSLSFKSATFKVKDTVTEVELIAHTDGFTNLDGCLKTTTKDTLSPGDAFIISSPAFDYNPNGHNIRVVLKLCTENGQNGSCITRKINVKP
ncbi:MAG: hypothetical protein AABZ00_15585 [Chloroflexota bacterium]